MSSIATVVDEESLVGLNPVFKEINQCFAWHGSYMIANFNYIEVDAVCLI